MKKNDCLTLTADNLGADLEGICRHEGLPVFVPVRKQLSGSLKPKNATPSAAWKRRLPRRLPIGRIPAARHIPAAADVPAGI